MKNPARLEDVPDIASQACHPQGYGELISMGADADSYFYHYDGLGSTDRVTGADEGVVNQYLYRVFGEETVLSVGAALRTGAVGAGAKAVDTGGAIK